MRRRTLLASAVGVAGALAGCGSPGAGRSPRRRDRSGDAAARPSATPASGTSLVRRGNPPDLCERPLRYDPGIEAIVEPAFGPDWSSIRVPELYERPAGLSPDATVVGVDGAVARAYPLCILAIHEVVNDVVPGGIDVAGGGAVDAVLVSYCPLCRSGLVASRRVDGATTRFAVSGHLWEPPGVPGGGTDGGNGDRTADGPFGAAPTDADAELRRTGNLVMYDEVTTSYWSQLLARAICGPLSGTRLEILPSTVTTWADWRRSRPDTEVLLPPPHSGTVATAPK